MINSLDDLYNMADNGIDLVGYTVSDAVAANADRYGDLLVDDLDGFVRINSQNLIILHNDC